MDPQRIKKIEDLIIQSKILNPQERAEWLALLDLMNDKQLLELENILQSSREARVISQEPLVNRTDIKPTVAPQPIKPVPQTLATTPSVLKEKITSMPAGLPKLSHIMNLPKLGQLEQKTNNVPKESLILNPSSLTRSSAAAPTTIIFEEKLKSVIAEKELPKGEPELELPEGDKTNGTDTTSKAHISDAANLTRLNYGALPPVPRPKVEPKVNRQESIVKSQPQIKPAMITPPVPPAAKPAIQPVAKKPDTAKPVSGPVPEIQGLVNKILAAKPPSPATAIAPPIIGLSRLPDKVLAQPMASLKVKPPEAPPAAAPLPPAAKSGERPLPAEQVHINPKSGLTPQSLVDLTQIGEENLVGGWDLLSDKISNLVRQYGYHQVQQNLEKSPLYQSYLQTGMAALKDQAGFGGNQPGLLGKAKFEQVADLLRAIQAG